MENGQRPQYFKSPDTNPVLSPEQWVHVFDILTPEDFLSVINTCPEWNELLHSKKTTTLLSLVVPFVIDYFPKATILAFRSVSTVAKTVIDSALVSRTYICSSRPSVHGVRGMLEYKREESLQRRRFNYELSVINKRYNFLGRGTTYRFLKCVDPNDQLSSTKNPFLTRRISIWINGDDDDYFRSLFKMLHKFVHHIWRLQCTLTHDYGARRQRVSVSALLQHFPNLKSLELIAPPFERPDRNRFGESVFPAMPNLQSLCLYGWFKHVESFSLALLRKYGAQLHTVSFPESILCLESVTIEFLREFLPNVRMLHLSGLNLLELDKISRVGWNLEKFSLKGGIYDDITMDQFLDFFGGFTNTLTELEMVFPSRSGFSFNVVRYTPERIKVLSKLKQLRLTRDLLLNNQWVWTFLEIMCPNVEVIHFDPSESYFEISDIKRLITDKAFRVLPKLQRIVFWRDENEYGSSVGKNLKLFKFVIRR